MQLLRLSPVVDAGAEDERIAPSPEACLRSLKPEGIQQQISRSLEDGELVYNDGLTAPSGRLTQR